MKHGPAARHRSVRLALRSVFSCQKQTLYKRDVPTGMIHRSYAYSFVCSAETIAFRLLV